MNNEKKNNLNASKRKRFGHIYACLHISDGHSQTIRNIRRNYTSQNYYYLSFAIFTLFLIFANESRLRFLHSSEQNFIISLLIFYYRGWNQCRKHGCMDNYKISLKPDILLFHISYVTKLTSNNSDLFSFEVLTLLVLKNYQRSSRSGSTFTASS